MTGGSGDLFVKPGEIEVSGLTYRYPKGVQPSLANISWRSGKGESLAVMGRSGAGKTTLLASLNGLVPHFYHGEFHGRVKVCNLDTQNYRVQTLAKYVGMVLQDPEAQIFGLTVESDVAFGLSNFGLPGRQINERVEEVLGLFGLRGLRHRSTAGLSGGEKQRLAIAGVMAMKPDVLVLDEPTAELDPGGKAQFFETLSRLNRERGTSVVMSGHDSSDFVGQASRILVLDAGTLVSDDKPAELFRDVARCRELGIPVPEISQLLWELRQRGAQGLENIALGFNGAERLMAELVRRARATGRAKDPPPALTPPKRIIIEIRDLVHQYSAEVTALRGIDLDIFDGEFLVIVGRNGSGKSTLVKHFNSLLRPTSGDVYVQGVNTRHLYSHELSKTVGFLFQNPDHQIFCPTVQTEVEFGLKTVGLGEGERRRKAAGALALVGLDHLSNRHPFTLGRGERQLVAVATVLAVQPKVIVVDEPTTGQDWAGVQRMMRLLTELHSAGHTIVMITHDMRLAVDFGERLAVLDNGRIIALGPPAEIFSSTQLVENAGLAMPPALKLVQSLAMLGFRFEGLDMKSVVNSLCRILSGAVPHVA